MNKHPLIGDENGGTVANLPAIRVDLDEIEFREDFQILTLLVTKIFRRAIHADALLTEPLPTEDELAAELGDLTHVFNDLNDAVQGKTEAHWEIEQWKQATSH